MSYIRHTLQSTLDHSFLAMSIALHNSQLHVDGLSAFCCCLAHDAQQTLTTTFNCRLDCTINYIP